MKLYTAEKYLKQILYFKSLGHIHVSEGSTFILLKDSSTAGCDVDYFSTRKTFISEGRMKNLVNTY